MVVILSLLCFFCLVLAGYGFSMWLQARLAEQRDLMARFRAMAGGTYGETGSLLKDQRLSRIPMFDALLGQTSVVAPLVRMIQQAGLRRRVGEVLLYIPLLAAIGYLVTALLAFRTPFRILIAFVLGMIPIMVVSRMRTKRVQKFSEQLADALDLVRSALQAGHGLIAAFQVVSETFPDPVAQEFRYLVEEVRLGLPFRDALYSLSARVGDPNVPILVIGILTAQDVGGNLAEVIENVTHTIRERAKLQREIQVLTAQGRLSGLVLTALPFVVGAFMFLYNPAYFGPMVTTSVGQKLLLYGVVSLLLGHLMVRRIVRIEV